MSTEVAIVGIGMHEFGRTEGVTGMEQGVIAVRRACADAGVKWEDVQFAFGGSAAAGAADTMVSQLGLTGLQFINVANGCATGGSALFSAYNTIRSGVFDLGIAIGFDKHERGAFRVDTRGAGLGNWYGASGLALTTQFFGMKINRYMEEYGITQDALARVSAKAFRNGAMNDIKAIVKAAHDRGVPVLVDAYQTSGAVPINFEELGADFLVGGVLKYMLSSPGVGFALVNNQTVSEFVPCFHPKLSDKSRSLS